MVYQSHINGLTYEQIAMNLNADPSTIQRTVRTFEENGMVKARKNEEKTLTIYDELLIIQSVLAFIYINYGLLHVKGLCTSPHHPQTDGPVEHFNQTLKEML